MNKLTIIFLKNSRKNRNAFTLIEITVVLIILGITAVIGVPSIFAQIERNKAQEAISTINTIRSAIESCGADNSNNFNLCNTFPTMGMDNPSNSTGTNPSSNFNYVISGATATGQYIITATRVGISANTITVTRGAGSVGCAGAGAYVGSC